MFQHQRDLESDIVRIFARQAGQDKNLNTRIYVQRPEPDPRAETMVDFANVYDFLDPRPVLIGEIRVNCLLTSGP